MLRVIAASAILLASVIGSAQAASCDPDKLQQEISTAMMTSAAKLTEADMTKISTAMMKVTELFMTGKVEEGCAAGAKVKEMLPK